MSGNAFDFDILGTIIVTTHRFTVSCRRSRQLPGTGIGSIHQRVLHCIRVTGFELRIGDEVLRVRVDPIHVALHLSDRARQTVHTLRHPRGGLDRFVGIRRDLLHLRVDPIDGHLKRADLAQRTGGVLRRGRGRGADLVRRLLELGLRGVLAVEILRSGGPGGCLGSFLKLDAGDIIRRRVSR